MRSRKIFCFSLISVLALSILGALPAVAGAQTVASSPQGIILPKLQLKITPAQIRTPEEMAAAAASEAAAPKPAPRMKPFLPTVGQVAYRGYKAKAAQRGGLQAPAAPRGGAVAPQAPVTTLTNPVNFDGVNANDTGGWYPPDTEGAVGLNHFVEVTNSSLDIYLKASPHTHVMSIPLSSFFGYNGQPLIDPRVVFDAQQNRWIVSANAYAESSAVQYFLFAVSQTADPTGAFYAYSVNVSDGAGVAGGVEWDFPQVGLDQNAVIFTGNFFDQHGNFIDARMFAAAKSSLYSGSGQSTSLFTGLAGTLAPPIVLDANTKTYLVAADIQDNKVSLYTLTNSAAIPPAVPTLSGPVSIPVPAYTIPPYAPQPGTSEVIDTSDSRFVNASTQIGNSLFQVHTINTGDNLATPRWYEFDTVNLKVLQSGILYRSTTSYDFNASIAANRQKDVFVTWSSTDTNVNAEVRFSGRRHTDPPGVIPSPGSLLYGSASSLTGNQDPGFPGVQRWGDYSATSLDPADPTGATAWIVNERILDTNTWGSRIGSIVLPLHPNLAGIYLLLLGE